MAQQIDAENKVIQRCQAEAARNQAISQIATDYFFVSSDTIINDLAEDLNHREDINAVGVVDADQKVLGVIRRAELFSLLGRPYGRDVLSRLPVTDIIQKSPSIRFDANIFTVSEELDEYLKSSDISYFALTDENNRFRGAFSSHDLLLYLSEITQRDIGLARKLQSKLVHERDLVVGRKFEFSSYSASAKGVGGDFYSIFQIDEQKWVMSVCDVSGKGVSASILTSAIWGMMSIYDFKHGMKSFIAKLNDYIAGTFEGEKFVTGIFMTYDEERNAVQLCDMGHSHIFLFRDAKMRRVSSNQRNLPLGVSEGTEPKISRFVPQEHDILLVVTDGLLEQESENLEVYSLERVIELMRNHHEKAVEVINDRIIDDFETFRGAHHLNDDVTYVLVKFRKQEIIL